MIGKVLFAVDGSVPAHQAAERVHGLLPEATEVLILEVVPSCHTAGSPGPGLPSRIWRRIWGRPRRTCLKSAANLKRGAGISAPRSNVRS